MNERRVIVLGGSGRFGQLIARRLAGDSRFEVVIAGRDAARAESTARSCGVSSRVLDAGGPRFATELREAAPWLVIDAAGPFQSRDYAVAAACICAGSHLIDIADGRRYVCGISSLDGRARAAGVSIVSGASSVPALTGAVVDHLAQDLDSIERIDIGITTSARPPGTATVAAILDYAGREIPAWREGRPALGMGWGPIRRRHIDGAGMRRFSDCDVPDLELLPRRYPGIREVRFGAGSESALLHGALRLWAMVVDMGWPSSWRPSAAALARLGGRLASSSGRSALFVEVVGSGVQGRTRRTWTLVAREEDGASIPGLPAVAMARRLASAVDPGARPCSGLLTLDEMRAEMDGLRLAIAEARVVA